MIETIFTIGIIIINISIDLCADNNIIVQIGSVNVLDDVTIPTNSTDTQPFRGSGSGLLSDVGGGGAVLLFAPQGTVTVTATGALLAEGGTPPLGTRGVGGGSGGAVLIQSQNLTLAGTVSVAGGSVMRHQDAGGGGGGRVTLLVRQTMLL